MTTVHRPRVAAIASEFWPGSHADLIVTRLMRGYEVMWVPLAPRVEVVSVFTDFVAPHDVSGQRAARSGAAWCRSVRDALTLGTSDLAVDGVVLVGEENQRSGRQPTYDERGHKLDCRARLFEEIAVVFRELGRTAPVFVDKHLAPTWEQARWMYDTARAMGVQLMAGSSVPVTVRCPPVQVPLGADVEEVVAVASGLGDAPIFHPLEVVESMIERRRGGETGVSAVQFLSVDAFLAAWEAGDRWSPALAEAALATVPHFDGSPADYYRQRPAEQPPAAAGYDRRLPPIAAAGEAVLIEYRDGVRVSVLLLTGYMLRRAFAIQLRDQAVPLVTWTPTGVKVPDQPMAGQAVPQPGSAKPATWNFDHLAFFVDQFLASGQPPFPVERTLLTTGVLDAAMTSRFEGGRRLETPHLAIEYAAPALGAA